MTESVRHQWVYTMHACATVHDAMSTLTGKQHQTRRTARGHGEREAQSRLERYEKDNGIIYGARSLRWHYSSIAISGQ